MLMCVLSADYLADSSAVFVLESGIQVGQHRTQGEFTVISQTSVSVYIFQSYLMMEVMADVGKQILHH